MFKSARLRLYVMKSRAFKAPYPRIGAELPLAKDVHFRTGFSALTVANSEQIMS